MDKSDFSFSPVSIVLEIIPGISRFMPGTSEVYPLKAFMEREGYFKERAWFSLLSYSSTTILL